MIQSVLPPEAYLPRTGTLPRECVSCSAGFLEGVRGTDGRLLITRLISTDPAAFLREEYQPGHTISI